MTIVLWFWEHLAVILRTTVQLTLLYFLVRGLRVIKQLLVMGQQDRIAREQTLAELSRKADALSRQTADLAHTVQRRDTETAAAVQGVTDKLTQTNEHIAIIIKKD